MREKILIRKMKEDVLDFNYKSNKEKLNDN